MDLELSSGSQAINMKATTGWTCERAMARWSGTMARTMKVNGTKVSRVARGVLSCLMDASRRVYLGITSSMAVQLEFQFTPKLTRSRRKTRMTMECRKARRVTISHLTPVRAHLGLSAKTILHSSACWLRLSAV